MFLNGDRFERLIKRELEARRISEFEAGSLRFGTFERFRSRVFKARNTRDGGALRRDPRLSRIPEPYEARPQAGLLVADVQKTTALGQEQDINKNPPGHLGSRTQYHDPQKTAPILR